MSQSRLCLPRGDQIWVKSDSSTAPLAETARCTQGLPAGKCWQQMCTAVLRGGSSPFRKRDRILEAANGKHSLIACQHRRHQLCVAERWQAEGCIRACLGECGAIPVAAQEAWAQALS